MVEMEATKSIFAEPLGDGPYVRVLDHFLTFPGFDYSKSQVAREVGISRITLDKIVAQLLKMGLLKPTRTIGRAQMYSLLTSNWRVKLLHQLDLKLSEAFSEQQAPLQQKIVAKHR